MWAGGRPVYGAVVVDDQAAGPTLRRVNLARPARPPPIPQVLLLLGKEMPRWCSWYARWCTVRHTLRPSRCACEFGCVTARARCSMRAGPCRAGIRWRLQCHAAGKARAGDLVPALERMKPHRRDSMFRVALGGRSASSEMRRGGFRDNGGPLPRLSASPSSCGAPQNSVPSPAKWTQALWVGEANVI